MVVKNKETGNKYRVFDIHCSNSFEMKTMFLIYTDYCGFKWVNMNDFILCAKGDGEDSN